MTPDASPRPSIPFDNSYARLPDRFFTRTAPTPVAAPRLIRLNDALARDLGLDPDALRSPHGLAILSGNAVADGSQPIATAYAGHQFGGFSPSLGDGRAVLLGEVVDRSGSRRDIQLKGAGPTPFSRRGDGRAALGPVLREYILSEAFAALGVPSTRALAAVATGEAVLREEPRPGGVLTRVAESHIRVGTFQYFAARSDHDALRALADHAIARHYPGAATSANPYVALLDGVVGRQARLIARWMGIGFIHGVMNTDNMAISGETIDFGPCAFLDAYDPAAVYSSIDQGGRYAYANQPGIAMWNLARFAEALLPLLGPDREAAIATAEATLGRFPARYEAAHAAVFRAKLGLGPADDALDVPADDSLAVPADDSLTEDLLQAMHDGGADFTLTFRTLADLAAATDDAAPLHRLRALFADPAGLDAWLPRWQQRLRAGPTPIGSAPALMRRANPALIPRNHLVEEAIAAAYAGDLAPFGALVEVLARPFDDQPAHSRFTAPPRPEQIVRATFCGT